MNFRPYLFELTQVELHYSITFLAVLLEHVHRADSVLCWTPFLPCVLYTSSKILLNKGCGLFLLHKGGPLLPKIFSVI